MCVCVSFAKFIYQVTFQQKKKKKSGAYTKLLSLESNLVSSSITTAKIYEFNANL